MKQVDSGPEKDSLSFFGFSKELLKNIEGLDKEYVAHVGVKHIVHQMMERNLEAFGDGSRNQKALFEAIGFSDLGAARFSEFIDPEITHYTLSNWLDLYLDTLFSPGGAISASNFPFQEETVNQVFSQKHSSTAEGEKTLKMINFTSQDEKDIWIRNEMEEAARKKSDEGKSGQVNSGWVSNESSIFNQTTRSRSLE
jgi:hypothetical protein